MRLLIFIISAFLYLFSFQINAKIIDVHCVGYEKWNGIEKKFYKNDLEFDIFIDTEKKIVEFPLHHQDDLIFFLVHEKNEFMILFYFYVSDTMISFFWLDTKIESDAYEPVYNNKMQMRNDIRKFNKPKNIEEIKTFKTSEEVINSSIFDDSDYIIHRTYSCN